MDNKKEYYKLSVKASNIVTKIQNEINRGKIYENQGQKEYRRFFDMLRASKLDYAEQAQLVFELNTLILNLDFSAIAK